MPAQEHGRAVLLRGFNVFTVKSARRNGRVADVVEQKVQQNPRKMQSNPQNEDPSGGTTGRVKPYGRLGWMGARAEYSRWGGCFRFPHFIGRRWRAARSNCRQIF